ncbi:sugar transferase [Candidatus Fermentibacteria bacterium]|nr:sugar transferase [Candidatus Fermentibacteria bacterium]
MRAATPLDRMYRWLAAGDAVIGIVSWVGAWGIRRAMDGMLARPVSPLGNHLALLPILLPLWLAVNASRGLYRRPTALGRLKEFQLLLQSVIAALVASMVLSFVLKELEVARMVVFLAAGLMLCLVAMERSMVRRWALRRAAHEGPLVRSVIVGHGELAQTVAHRLGGRPGWQAAVGYLGPEGTEGRMGALPRLGDRDDLPRVLDHHGIHEVYVAVPDMPHQELLDLVARCHGRQASFKVASGMFEVVALQGSIDEAAGIPVVELGPGLLSPGESLAKRLLDLWLAVTLGILILPLALLVAVAIRLDSRGPILFCHARVGKDGCEFTMFKFRTMRHDADPFQQAPRDTRDPRITRVGRWLRRTSLDELPQILNVLRGAMSFVGPRPEMPFIVARYQGWQSQRLSVKPGMTGLWQIMGRKDLPLEDNLEYDFYYIRNQSILLDITILLRTIPTVFLGKGAY